MQRRRLAVLGLPIVLCMTVLAIVLLRWGNDAILYLYLQANWHRLTLLIGTLLICLIIVDRILILWLSHTSHRALEEQTDVRIKEIEVREANLRRVLIFNIRHEMLQKIPTEISLLLTDLDRASSEDEQREIRERLDAAIDKFKDQVGGLKKLEDFWKDRHLSLDPQRINDQINRIVQNKHQEANQIGIQLLFKPSHKNSICSADWRLIETALNNLIDNAFKYSKKVQMGTDGSDQSWVIVSIETDPSEVIIRVEDNGIGIPENEIDRVFEPGIRLATPKQVQGSGVGLFLVKEIAELHNGCAEVLSKINEMTAFIITLPV